MSLFFDLLSSINDPNQKASVSQLESIMGPVQQLSQSTGIPASQMQGVMSSLGAVLRPALQQKQSTLGAGQMDNMLGQMLASGTGASMLSSFLTPQSQQQIAQVVAQKTGLSPNMIQAALPTLIPAVLGLLGMGTPNSGAQGGNPILNSFLNSKKDSDVDLGMVMKYAGRFLNP
jgi:hypothetical protein